MRACSVVGVGGSEWRQGIKQAYLGACEYDITAFKPGNVSVYSEGHNMTVSDFRRSAAVSEPFLTDLGSPLGEKIYNAVRATQIEVGCNTNLGIVLLCAPMIQAMQTSGETISYRTRLQRILNTTTQQDAEWVYRAIRLASPGGLGESEQQDAHIAPKVSLTEAMRIACDRDRIAWQYVNCYKDVLDFGIKRYHIAVDQWGDANWAAVAVFIGLLCRIPDSHIERKFGNQFTGMVNTRMTLLEEELLKAERPERLIPRLQEVDAEFKSLGINPGTTADLTVASLLAVSLEQSLGKDKEKYLRYC